MLDTFYAWAPLAYLPQKDSARCAPKEHAASLYTKCTRFDIIAVLYTCTTVAHAPPPTRALSHTQVAPCGTVASRATHTRALI